MIYDVSGKRIHKQILICNCSSTNGCKKCNPPMKTCEHKRIHTERLWKEEPEKGKPVQYVIESICAECGLYLGDVDVHHGASDQRVESN